MTKSDPKKPNDPAGETTPSRPDNREGAKETENTHLINREGEADARTGTRRPESDARETSDGSIVREREGGYRNSDEG